MSKPEIYIAFDIEADGPCPGLYSMLSLGCAAYLPDGTLVDTFYTNLELLEGAQQHPDTMEWWKGQPDAWEQCRKNLEVPEVAMERFDTWIASLSHKWKPTAVAYPAGFDWPFLFYYCHRFLNHCPLGFICIDMKTLGMALLGTTYRETAKKRMPERWFNTTLPHDHNALNDAVEQGYTFVQMWKDLHPEKKLRVVEIDPPRSLTETFGKLPNCS